jgi:hypothetical protein
MPCKDFARGASATQDQHNKEDFQLLVVVQEDKLDEPATAQYCEEMKALFGWENVTVVFDPQEKTRPLIATEDPTYPNGAVYVLIDEEGVMEKVRMKHFELDAWIEDLTSFP